MNDFNSDALSGDVKGDTSSDSAAMDKSIAIRVAFNQCNYDQQSKVAAAFVKSVNVFSLAVNRGKDQAFGDAFGYGADLSVVKTNLGHLYQPFYNGISVMCQCANAGNAAGTAPVGFAGGTINLCAPFFGASTARQSGVLVHEVAHAYRGMVHETYTKRESNPYSYQAYFTRLASGG